MLRKEVKLLLKKKGPRWWESILTPQPMASFEIAGRRHAKAVGSDVEKPKCLSFPMRDPKVKGSGIEKWMDGNVED